MDSRMKLLRMLESLRVGGFESEFFKGRMVGENWRLCGRTGQGGFAGLTQSKPAMRDAAQLSGKWFEFGHPS